MAVSGLQLGKIITYPPVQLSESGSTFDLSIDHVVDLRSSAARGISLHMNGAAIGIKGRFL